MKSKLGTLLLSLAVAMGLWLYVVTNVSTEREQTFSGVSVVLENEVSLMDKDLMLLKGRDATVSFTLSGSMSELDELNAGNLKVTVDLSTITEPGEHQCTYKVIYPSGVSGVSLTKRLTESVKIEVVEYAEKTVPVELVFTGDQPEELFVNTAGATLGVTEVGISGPKDEVEQITKAGIVIDQSELTGTIYGEYRYVLMNDDNEPMNSDNITTDTGEIYLNLPVEYFKEIPLVVQLTEGGGIKEKNAVIKLDVETLTISGSREAVDKIDELVIAKVDLAKVDLATGHEEDATINLPDNLTNHTGVDMVHVTVKLRGISSKTFTLDWTQIEMLNVPEGMVATISTLKLDVTVRGIPGELSALSAEQIRATIDFTDKTIGTFTLPVTLEFPEGADVGAYGDYAVTVVLAEKPIDAEPTED